MQTLVKISQIPSKTVKKPSGSMTAWTMMTSKVETSASFLTLPNQPKEGSELRQEGSHKQTLNTKAATQTILSFITALLLYKNCIQN
jgi:hypothetical protein